jgi:hypothetical protein
MTNQDWVLVERHPFTEVESCEGPVVVSVHSLTGTFFAECLECALTWEAPEDVPFPDRAIGLEERLRQYPPKFEIPSEEQLRASGWMKFVTRRIEKGPPPS